MKLTLTIQNQQTLESTLQELSTEHGGAWVAVRRGFSIRFTFLQYKCPSAVPDSFYDLSDNQIGYKGEIVGFTRAAVQRERNRALGING